MLAARGSLDLKLRFFIIESVSAGLNEFFKDLIIFV